MAITLDGTTGITTPGLTNTGTETLVNLTTTGNTTLGDASTDTLNVGNGGLVKDASGNVGVGVTPTVKFEVNGAAKATSLSLTTALPVSSGGTNASSASITAFNNITGYTATGATGTTSTNLVFSASPTMTGTATMATARPSDLGGSNTGSVAADGNWHTILTNGSLGLYQVMAGAHTSGKHSDGVFLAACTFGNNNQTSTLIVTNYNAQGQVAIQWSGNDLQLKTTYSFSPATITYSYFTLSQ